MEEEPPEPSREPLTPSAAARLRSATLPCENCGRSTPHRILRWDPRAGRRGGPLSGVARCQECRWTHPFAWAPPERVDLPLIVSEGAVSEARRVSLPRRGKLQVGSGLPGSVEPLVIHRLDDGTGRAVSSATAGEVGTIWATRDRGAIVAVSIVEGRHTQSVRLPLPHGTRLRVGDPLSLDTVSVEIVGLRARGHTWRRLGDEFPADEVDRVYGRRTSMPPAGSSPWRRVRARPSSATRVTSVAARSRSTPGTRTTRRTPRARIAEGGAAVQSDSPS